MSKQHADAPGEKRLIALRREIAAAEARLLELRTSIKAAKGQEEHPSFCNLLAENGRLLEQSHLASQDAADSRAALEVAIKASETDPLTGLRNRSALSSMLVRDVALARRQKTVLAIYFLDIDDFKLINDRYGHATGDLLLQHVANTLLATVRASDAVFRLGGDEFVVLASQIRPAEVEPVARKLEQALRDPIRLSGSIDQVFSISVSIGSSIFPKDGDLPDDLMQRADEAMYRSKRLRSVEP